MQFLLGYSLWSAVVGGVTMYCINVHALLPYLLGRRAPPSEVERGSMGRKEEEERGWVRGKVGDEDFGRWIQRKNEPVVNPRMRGKRSPHPRPAEILRTTKTREED